MGWDWDWRFAARLLNITAVNLLRRPTVTVGRNSTWCCRLDQVTALSSASAGERALPRIWLPIIRHDVGAMVFTKAKVEYAQIGSKRTVSGTLLARPHHIGDIVSRLQRAICENAEGSS